MSSWFGDAVAYCSSGLGTILLPIFLLCQLSQFCFRYSGFARYPSFVPDIPALSDVSALLPILGFARYLSFASDIPALSDVSALLLIFQLCQMFRLCSRYFDFARCLSFASDISALLDIPALFLIFRLCQISQLCFRYSRFARCLSFVPDIPALFPISQLCLKSQLYPMFRLGPRLPLPVSVVAIKSG